MSEREIAIRTAFIRLDQLLKLAGETQTGGTAKEAIQTGHISVNGQICTERGRKLRNGDTVELNGRTLRVAGPDTLP